MRLVRPALFAPAGFALALVLAACSNGVTVPDAGDGRVACKGVLDCPTGQGCVEGYCAELPCQGRCGPDEQCRANACVATDGLDCSDDASVCPRGFQCSTLGQCQRECTVDDDCTAAGFGSCNIQEGVCGQCTFNSDCSGATPVCDSTTSQCVGCLDDDDCTVEGVAAGRFCEQGTRTCQTGCNDDLDCAGGQRCSGATPTSAGRCIECTPGTEVNDCAVKAPKVRCEPTDLLCVECLSNADCTSAQCDLDLNRCVECVENEACPKGWTCDLDVFQCFEGCNGPVGGDNCPDNNPRLPACDVSIGERGTCVQCLRDADCQWGHVCKKTGNASGLPECVPGCRAGLTGAPNDERCAASAPETRTQCDPNQGSYGACVECINDSHCPANEVCDTERKECRCKAIGETCTSTSDCGYRVINDVPQCTASNPLCITQVSCDGTPKNVSTRVCTIASGQNAGTVGDGGFGKCPVGYITEWASDGSGGFAKQCVPIQYKCN